LGLGLGLGFVLKELDPSAAEFRRSRQPETSGAAASRIWVGVPAEIYGRRRRRIFLGVPRR